MCCYLLLFRCAFPSSCRSSCVDAATVLTARRALDSAAWALFELLWFWACAGSVAVRAHARLPQPFPGASVVPYYLPTGPSVVAACSSSGLRAFAEFPARRARGGADGGLRLGGLRGRPGPVGTPLLRRPPLAPSLLDLLGPWPWYSRRATCPRAGAVAVLVVRRFRLGHVPLPSCVLSYAVPVLWTRPHLLPPELHASFHDCSAAS